MWEQIGEVALDSLIDAAKIFGLAFAIHLLLSFFEGKLARLLERNRKWGPLMGSLTGAIPQCGISVVGTDLYLKRHLTIGALIAIYLSCSDEALPILFSDFANRWYMGFVVLGIKIVAGMAIGYLVDLLLRKKENHEVEEHLEHCAGEEQSHHGCCGHEVEGHESPWKEHLLHPLLHSLKIFAYSFAVLFLFGCIVEVWVGEEAFASFLASSHYFSPLYAVLVGLIPSCASSVLLANLYIGGGLPFGALLAGLCANAGLGPLYLFKNRKEWKKNLLIYGILIVSALAIGYAFIWLR